MLSLSDKSIEMLKKDAKLNHESGLRNYDLYLDLVTDNINNKAELGHIIVSAQIDFENAMNLYGTIKLYRENFNTYKVSRNFYLKMETIWHDIKILKNISVTSDEASK